VDVAEMPLRLRNSSYVLSVASSLEYRSSDRWGVCVSRRFRCARLSCRRQPFYIVLIECQVLY
jgi:hypothetical protein